MTGINSTAIFIKASQRLNMYMSMSILVKVIIRTGMSMLQGLH